MYVVSYCTDNKFINASMSSRDSILAMLNDLDTTYNVKKLPDLRNQEHLNTMHGLPILATELGPDH